MKKCVLVLAVILTFMALFVRKGDAIKCYACYSQSTADDCWLNSGTHTCNGDSVCYGAVHKMYGIELHYKGCVAKHHCNSYKICGAVPDDKNCKLKCCTTDKCNSSTRNFSVISVFVGLLVAIINLS